VGLNYNNAEGFPDRVAIIFGKPIAAKNLYDAGDIRASTTAVKKAVAERLKTLTTHIENEETYAKTLSQLDAIGVDYLDPKATNATLQESLEKAIPSKKKTGIGAGFGKVLFTLLNLPPVLLWRWVGKPKVWEPEFMGTLRYAFALLVYPLYYALVFALASMLLTPLIALVLVLGLFVFNLLFVRLASDNMKVKF